MKIANLDLLEIGACEGKSAEFFVSGRRIEGSQIQVTEGQVNCAANDSWLSRRYVESLFGNERAQQLIRARLPNENANLPENISKLDFWQLGIDNISETNDEGHGATMRPLPRFSWGMVFSSVNQLDSVGKGLELLPQLVALVPAGVVVTLGYRADRVHLNFGFSDYSDVRERRERYLELFALAFHCLLLWVTAAALRVLEIRLSGALEARDGSMLSGLAPICYRQGSGLTIVYDRSQMCLPLGVRKYKYWGGHETQVFRDLVSKQTDAVPRHRDVTAERVVNLLARKSLSQQDVANAVGMSVATLQRRLIRAGTSFRELSKEARRERLICLLAANCDLDEIAEELGLSDRRSLWRASQEWLGMSPTEYRNGRKNQAS